MVKLKLPPTFGVPLIVPPVESVNPVGKLPLVNDHVTGAKPPVDWKVNGVYGCPTMASGSGPCVVEMASTGTMWIVNDTAEIWRGLPESCTCTLTEVPAAGVTCDGVPWITPAELRFNPAGSVPDASDHVWLPVPPVLPKLKV